ncbi:uncharacterized protein VTP21DRAFT_11445 [Calcarisporiella thermophila]|uniref:uncharacterized protein n=1 Tax=Calcarisporiella thermophila TaxID=911321 RepID=UPI0037431983
MKSLEEEVGHDAEYESDEQDDADLVNGSTRKRKRKQSDSQTTPTRSSTRVRKEVQRFSPLRREEKQPIEIRKGEGAPLGEIAKISEYIDKNRVEDVLKPLHRILFGRVESPRNIKSNLRQFSGLTIKDEKEEEQMKMKFGKWMATGLKDLARFLNLETSGDKSSLIDRIVDFLKKPHDTGYKRRGEKKKRRSKTVSSKKSKKKVTENSTEEVVTLESGLEADESESDSASADGADDYEDSAILSGRGEEADVSSNVEDESPMRRHSKKVIRKRAERSIEASKKKKEQKAETKEESRRVDDADDEGEGGAWNGEEKRENYGKSKDEKVEGTDKEDKNESAGSEAKNDEPGGPSDKAIVEEIKRILKDANLNEITAKQVRQRLNEHFGVDLSERKKFINSIVDQEINSLQPE